jgi:hypothetical protein
MKSASCSSNKINRIKKAPESCSGAFKFCSMAVDFDIYILRFRFYKVDVAVSFFRFYRKEPNTLRSIYTDYIVVSKIIFNYIFFILICKRFNFLYFEFFYPNVSGSHFIGSLNLANIRTSQVIHNKSI